jgi:hypothetical protein
VLVYPQQKISFSVRGPVRLEAEPTKNFVAAFEAVALRARWGQVLGGRVAPAAAGFDVVERGGAGTAAVGAAAAPGIKDVFAETPLGVTLVQ